MLGANHASAAPPMRGFRLFCDACERAVPAAGCHHAPRHTLCPGCSQEYALAVATGRPVSIGQYVRDKRFGEGDLYALPG